MTWFLAAIAYVFILLLTCGFCAMGQAEDRASMALALWRQFAPRRVL